MEEFSDIIDKLREEERRGKLKSNSNVSQEEVEIPTKLSEETIDEKDINLGKDFDHDESNTRLILDNDSLGCDSTDLSEIFFQSTSNLMLFLDKSGRIVKINKAGIAFSGFSKNEIIGKRFWKMPGVFSRNNVSIYLKVFKNSLMGKKTEKFIATLEDKTGKTHTMEFITHPIIEQKKIKHILVIAKDITDLKESKNKYRLITESTSDSIALSTFSLNPKYTYISPSTKKLMGYEPKELIGKPCFDIIHPDDKKIILSIAKKYISSKGKKLFTGKDSEINENLEYRIFDKKGDLHYFKSTINIIGNEILFISKDITKEKESENKLRINEERLRTIVNNIPGIIYRCANDENWTMEYISGEVDKILGYPVSDFINNKVRNYASVIHPDDKEMVNETVQDSLNKKQHYVIEYRIIHKDGSTKWIYEKGNGVFNNNGDLLYITGAILDVTERKISEEKFNSAMSQLDATLNIIPDVIGVQDNSHNIIRYNKAGYDLLNKTYEEVVGKKCYELINQTKPCKICATSSCYISKKPEQIEKYEESLQKWFDVRSYPILDKDGNIEMVVEHLRDITNKKKAEDELKETNEMLLTINHTLEDRVEKRTIEIEKLLKQKDEFIHRLSHDLKTPLTPFITLLPILHKRVDDNPENQMIFDTLNRSAKRMKQMISKTLEHAKLNALTELKLEKINLSSLIKNSIETFNDNQNDKTIEIINLANDKSEVIASSSHINSLISNLFSNAIKYSNEHKCNIRIDSKRGKNDDIIVSVKDNGVGLTAEQVEFIFDEFYKTDESRHDLESNGLGLSICKRIIELHHGEIWVESQGNGKGSTFYFTLKTSDNNINIQINNEKIEIEDDSYEPMTPL